jgi:hypothetical protein
MFVILTFPLFVVHSKPRTANQMADDIDREVEREEGRGYRRISECLVDVDRGIVPVGLGRADSALAISKTLYAKFFPKLVRYSFCLASGDKAGTFLDMPGWLRASGNHSNEPWQNGSEVLSCPCDSQAQPSSSPRLSPHFSKNQSSLRCSS